MAICSDMKAEVIKFPPINAQVKFKVRLATLSEQVDSLKSFHPESIIQVEGLLNYLFDLTSIISSEFAQEFKEKLSPKEFEEIFSELGKIKSILNGALAVMRFGMSGKYVDLISWFKRRKFPDISKSISKKILKINWIFIEHKIKNSQVT